MVKPLSFKGDKKTKKRKRVDTEEKFGDSEASASASTSKAISKPQEEEAAPDDDSWVTAEASTDVVGPIIFVLPSEPPSCIACDTNGKVFASVLENMIDNNPTTAEPHDVRQVWVANRVAGTETFSFKGHHGKFGILSANTEAVSPLESFLAIPTADTPGTFQIQTLRDTFLTVKPSTSSKENAQPEIRGDADAINFNTTLRIRMQARFKPKLKASKEEKASQKISRKELEEAVGRKLDDDEVRKLKKARREGDYHEALLLFKVKNKHDKFFASDIFEVKSPEGTYIYDILPVGAGLASISSDDCLRLLDPLSLDAQPLNTFKKVNTDVTCLNTIGEGDSCVILTAGRDGKTLGPEQRLERSGVVRAFSRHLSLPLEAKSYIIFMPSSDDQNAPILSLACSKFNTLAAGTELTNHQATVSIWYVLPSGVFTPAIFIDGYRDARSLEAPVVQYVESHSDDVTEVSPGSHLDGIDTLAKPRLQLQFHPTEASLLLSGSTDGLVNIYNTTITDEEEALHQTINHGHSIHRANFLSNTDIFALSHDEKFSMYELVTNPEEGVEEPAPVHYGDMRENIGGEYVANVLSRPEGGAVLGIGTHSKNEFDLVQLKPGKPWTFAPETKVTLAGAHGSEIVRSFCFLDAGYLGHCGREPTAIDPSSSFHSPRTVADRMQDLELVDKALQSLRRYERSHPRAAYKPNGIVQTVIQYAVASLPRLLFQGPPADGRSTAQYRAPSQVADAVVLLEKAAQLNSSDAIFLLAQMNFYGNFSYPKDYSEAFRRYHQLATLNGNSSAQHMVGFMYATGIGGAVERDQAKALLYHTFAAEGGDTRSAMTVAFRYHSGIGVARNCDMGVKYYKNVAQKAIEWHRSGPPGGMAYVQDSFHLADNEGGIYGEGASFSSAGNNALRGGPSSDAHAALDDVLEYLDLMSRKGDFKATFSLGRIHYDGQKGLARNMKDAKRYFMKVAKLYWTRNGQIIGADKPGLEKIATKCAGYLGQMFLRGEGVDQSFEKAQTWFQRGIKSGDSGSQYGMGLMYLEGLGVPKNSVLAQQLFKASADQGYAPAQVSLGAMYLDQGTDSDIKVANKYFELAQRYGNIEAYYFLGELIDQGVGRDRSCQMATMYYKNVAEKTEPFLTSFAEANMAYEQGDYELALLGYMHAAEQGYEKAQANVAYILDQQKSRLTIPSWLLFVSESRPPLLQNAALALIYWTRSAKQSNIDSMVKMGDYYLNGIGTQADMDKAASCYTAASEYPPSAQALYNLGWMHENGVGLDQDFHLAKRYYDHALETNEEAYLPVTLSLFKLRIRSAWNSFTHGKVNSIIDEPNLAPQKQWSLSEWISNFLQDDHPYYADNDDDDNYISANDPMPGGDADGLYDDLIEDGIIESLIIIGLAAALYIDSKGKKLTGEVQERVQMHKGRQLEGRPSRIEVSFLSRVIQISTIGWRAE
ncbi:ubiquitin- ligase sel1 ubx2 protein [Rutstroemia sp. NJR-2017a BBW]|nr:ubiquitin- ligase sel1 ubx2 protein [Rutstroemia sp. NJR-2017a BBW]PQE08700.1 ubiquitin- ligase sel1 ubx2 protein [Rutstroemia sp. NJR-2017a BBW]